MCRAHPGIFIHNEPTLYTLGLAILLNWALPEYYHRHQWHHLHRMIYVLSSQVCVILGKTENNISNQFSVRLTYESWLRKKDNQLSKTNLNESPKV